jgi:ABC-type nitrate/sulfonate/bicarbonate transport system substrate-binding protein
MSHDTLVLALDWSPNILHAGFFLALEQDAFSEANLVIEWFSPETDNYQKKPIQRLMDGEVDLCIGPSEHLMFYAYDEKNMKPEARAIASLLSKGQSAFVSHQIAGMRNPANWPGNTYIGYDTPLETAIIQSMVEYSGGKGMVQMVQPGRLQVWDAFLEKGNSIAWIFSHWEGQLAKMQGVELDYFYPEEYGVPYGYSSVIMAGNQLSKEKKEQLKKFLSVLSNSYSKLATTENIPKMAGLLCSFVDHPNFSDKKMIAAALSDIQPALSTEGNRVWGEMKEQRWAAYINWMRQNELIPDQVAKVPSADWYTHEYLPVEN